MFDQHVQKHEELRHRLHAERREQARAGDETLTLETEAAQLARIQFLKFCREQEARDRKNAERRLQEEIRDALRDAQDQIREVRS